VNPVDEPLAVNAANEEQPAPTRPPRVAIVTGGGSGIGLASATALVALGTRCMLVGRSGKRLRAAADRLNKVAAPRRAAADRLNRMAAPLRADLTKPGSPERVAERTLKACGRIDLVVHSAGVFEKQPVGEVEPEAWRRVIDINLTAVMALTRACWDHLAVSRGQIVLISSIAALKAFEGNAAYAASKGGMNALGEVLRLEGRDLGIRVITLCPAQVDTELWPDQTPEEVRAQMMPAEAVGKLVASLVSTDRRIDIAPVVIRPVRDPWREAPQP